MSTTAPLRVPSSRAHESEPAKVWVNRVEHQLGGHTDLRSQLRRGWPALAPFVQDHRRMRRLAGLTAAQAAAGAANGALVKIALIAGPAGWAAVVAYGAVLLLQDSADHSFRTASQTQADVAASELDRRFAQRMAQHRRPPPGSDQIGHHIEQVKQVASHHAPFLLLDAAVVAGSVAGLAILAGPLVAIAAAGAVAGIGSLTYIALSRSKADQAALAEARSTRLRRFRDLLTDDRFALLQRTRGLDNAAAALHTASSEQVALAATARRFLLKAGLAGGMVMKVVQVAALVGMATGNGALVAPLFLAIQAIAVASRLPHNLPPLQDGLEAAALVANQLRRPLLVRERTAPLDLARRPKGGLSVDFDHVFFGHGYHHDDREPLNLRDASLHLAAGEVVALFAENRQGKSTALDLIARLDDVDAGAVRLGGVDVRDLRLATVDRSVAHMAQRPGKGDGTVREDLLLGNPHATGAHLAYVARLTGVDEIGLDRVLGDRPISGGEEKRIALARALLDPAPVLLLDEPTSDIDAPSTVPLMRAALAYARSQGRTVIVVTHDVDVVALTDRTVTLEDGAFADHQPLRPAPTPEASGIEIDRGTTERAGVRRVCGRTTPGADGPQFTLDLA